MRLVPTKLCHRPRFWCFWLIATITFLFYIEFVTYYRNSLKWLKPECQTSNQGCTKILLVADPQIIGVSNEVLHYLTPVSIFDSDRYLGKTYRAALNFARPDIVVFLGDLMDEGSTADSREFHGYVRRLFDIFLDDNDYVKVSAGDNDIGGEGNEPIRSDVVKFFDRAFAQPDLVQNGRRNLTFFKVNRITNRIPVYNERQWGARNFSDTSVIFVGLSHLPLLFTPSNFVDKVINKMAPHLLFSGHLHKSMVVSTDAKSRSDVQIMPVTPDNNQRIHEFRLGVKDLYEVVVPTCSYRMGTEMIGYGFAILEKSRVRYTVLWSPSRFYQIRLYWYFLVAFAGSFCLRLCWYCCCQRYPSGSRRIV